MKKVIFGAIVILLCLSGYIGFVAIKSKPLVSGELKVGQLKTSVQVIRDNYGIPHIIAKNREDAQFALGFTMASDRLFQMDLLRRISAGRLSEIFGKDLIKTDTFLRKMRLRKSISENWERNYEALPDKAKILAYKFIEGVNHYIRTQTLPLEFILLGYTPEKFTLIDSVSITGYIALSFAEGIIADSLFSKLYDNFPKSAVDELLVRQKSDPHFQNRVNLKTTIPNKFFQETSNIIHNLRKNFSMFHGSNSWVVSGKKSTSGKPILANDPHIAIANPSTWYEAHIHTPDYQIYGHYIPGIPFAGLAHDSNRAWAITMSEVDDLDLYLEKVDLLNKKVMFRNQWVPLKIESDVIKVKGESPVQIENLITPHGPVLNGTDYAKDNEYVSVRWSYHLPNNNSLKSVFLLNESKSIRDLEDALSYAAAPGFNVTFADKEGNIGWHIMGKIPRRKRPGKSYTMLNGWSGEDEYLGYRTIKQNPHLYNPKSNFIASANYYPDYIIENDLTGYWQPSDRIERIHSILGQKDKWSQKDFEKMSSDSFVQSAKSLLPIYLKEITPSSSIGTNILEELREWDKTCEIDSTGCTLYYLFNKHLGREVFLAQLGKDHFKSFCSVADYWHSLKNIIMNEKSYWWDNQKTKEKKELRKDILNQAFQKFKKDLIVRFGPYPKDWKWGNLHSIYFSHPLGKVPLLNKLFDIGPFPAPGGSSQLNNILSGKCDLDFEVSIIPSTRRIVDFSDVSNSSGILPTGNSGHFLSPHYDDQVQLFLNGKFRKQITDIDEIQSNSSFRTFHLIP